MLGPTMTALCPACYGQCTQPKSDYACITCKGAGRIPIPAAERNRQHKETDESHGA